MTEEVECPKGCGSFIHIGQHWSKGNVCSEPSLSDEQKQILKGILMGDGSVNLSKRSKRPVLTCEMTNKEYLEYIDSILGIFSTGVSSTRTAEEAAEENRKRGFRPNAKAENYSDKYELCTRSLKQLKPLHHWYSSGEKVFPENLDITPTILKHWYVGDGHYSLKEESKRGNIVLAMNNERENKEKIENYFHGIDVEIGRWREYDAGDYIDCAAVFHADETEQLFEYMGEPLPGFQYKWPADYRD